MSTIAERINSFNKDRLPEMLPRKMDAMQVSVFGFFRGTCHLFAEDYSSGFSFEDNSRIWICGDLHFENFGTYKDLERKVYFDINDFDEAVLAPVSLELTRLITSFYVAAGQFNLPVSKLSAFTNEFFQSYYRVIKKGKPLNGYKAIRSDMINQLINTVMKRKEQDLLNKYVKPGKNPVFKIIDGHTFPVQPKIIEELKKKVNKWAVKKGLPYNALDITFRIAGTGSLGIRHYVALLQHKGEKKYALLDIKEAIPSCNVPWLTFKQPKWKNQAFRVIQLQKKIQFMPPGLLKTLHFNDTWFYTKFLQPTQDKIDINKPPNKLKMLTDAAADLGEIVASAQLRTCGFKGAGTVQKLQKQVINNKAFKNAIVKYAAAYSKQVSKDYAGFCASMKKQTPLPANKKKKKKMAGSKK